MTFIIAVCLLLLIVLAVLLWAALRTPRRVIREDLTGRLQAELSDDVSAGILDADDLPAAAADIDVERQQAQHASAGKRGLWWILIVLVAVAAVLLYWQSGNWRAAIHGDRAAVMHRAQGMLAQLQAHLVEHPEDKQGWVTLARAKSALGDYKASARAYNRAVSLDATRNPALLARWGEALVLADPNNLTQQEHRIFSEVLRAAPDNVRGLWYGGLLALDAGERKLASARWQRLLKQNIPAPLAAFVRSRLVALGVVAPTGEAASMPSAPTLGITIELSAQVAKQVQAGDTLFVFARASSGGPPVVARRIPIAQPAKQFPLHVLLGDDDAMVADRQLSMMLGERMQVGVFLSHSGKVSSAPQGPQATKLFKLRSGKNALTLTLEPAATNNPG